MTIDCLICVLLVICLVVHGVIDFWWHHGGPGQTAVSDRKGHRDQDVVKLRRIAASVRTGLRGTRRTKLRENNR